MHRPLPHPSPQAGPVPLAFALELEQRCSDREAANLIRLSSRKSLAEPFAQSTFSWAGSSACTATLSFRCPAKSGQMAVAGLQLKTCFANMSLE